MLSYPLTLSFKIIAIAPQVKVTDAAGSTVLYVRQKVLALRENVRVFEDEAQQRQLYEIQADRILDFSARYRVSTPDGRTVGTAGRKGMRSLWSATYVIADADDREIGTIREENPFVKLLDGLVSEIPLVGGVLAMLINPSYLVDLRGQTVLRLKKRPAFFEGRFTLDKLAEFDEQDEAIVLTSTLMMLLLERGRG